MKQNDPLLFYQGCNVITELSQPQNDVLYICLASQLRKDFLNNKNIGLIILPDTKLSINLNFECEWLIWEEDTLILELIHRVQTVFLNYRQQLNNTSLLFETLMNGNGIDELIKSACRILGNPILLVDSAYRVISMAGIGEINDIVWLDALKYGYCSNELITKFKTEELLIKLNSSKKPVLFDNCFSSGVPRILGKSVVDGKDVAYIGVMAYNKPIENFHIEIIEVLCNLIALELKNDPEKSVRATAIYKSLILDLLKEKVHNPYYLHHRLVLAQWKTKTHFYVLHIPIMKDDINNYYLDYLQESFEHATIYVKAVVYKDSIILLLNFDTSKEAEKALLNISNVLKDNKINAGISRSFDLLFSLPHYYQQAIAAYHVGESIYPEEQIHQYQDLAQFHMIAEVNQLEILKDICDPGYHKLQKYDSDYNTDYLHTLHQYALCSCSISRTADQLFVHRNTISYRLEKISEISGYDLTKGEDIFKYLLSYKIETWLKLQ